MTNLPIELIRYVFLLFTAEMIVEKSTIFNIEIDITDLYDYTAFHLATCQDNSKIVEMFIQKSVKFNIDLNFKIHYNCFGWTALHFACYYGITNSVDLIIQKVFIFTMFVFIFLKLCTFILTSLTTILIEDFKVGVLIWHNFVKLQHATFMPS